MLRRWAAAACLAFLAGCGRSSHLKAERRGGEFILTLSPATGADAEQIRTAAGGPAVVVPLQGARAPRRGEALPLAEPPGRAVLERGPGGAAQVALWLDPAYPRHTAAAGGAVTVTLDLVHDERHTVPVDPGVTWDSGVRCRPDRVQRYHVVRLSPAAVPRLRVVAAGPRLTDRAPLPEIYRGAAAALNGGYFDLDSGCPLGALKIDGEWIRAPMLHRTALFLPRHGRPFIGVPEWSGVYEAGGRSQPLPLLNSRPDPGAAAVLTTPRWPFERSFAGFSATPVPALRAVLHTRAPVGTPVAVRLQTVPDVDGCILGAGPRLVDGGRVRVTAAAERFRRDITNSVCARSGVGVMPGGGVVLVYVDARNGMRLEEFAAFMAELGCQSALNLDGNTSSTLVVGGVLVGLPAAGTAVAVPDALVVEPAR